MGAYKLATRSRSNRRNGTEPARIPAMAEDREGPMMASCNGRCVRNRDRGIHQPVRRDRRRPCDRARRNRLEHSRPAIPRVDAERGWYYLIHPRSGWSAECEDCPYTIGLDYGQRIHPRAEFDDTDPDAGPRPSAGRTSTASSTLTIGHVSACSTAGRWKLSTST